MTDNFISTTLSPDSPSRRQRGLREDANDSRPPPAVRATAAAVGRLVAPVFIDATGWWRRMSCENASCSSARFAGAHLPLSLTGIFSHLHARPSRISHRTGKAWVTKTEELPMSVAKSRGRVVPAAGVTWYARQCRRPGHNDRKSRLDMAPAVGRRRGHGHPGTIATTTGRVLALQAQRFERWRVATLRQ